MNEIIKELGTEFSLKFRYLLILEQLYNKSLSAHDISKLTNIPMGRIYSFLNELLSWGLIEKTSQRPALYTMTNPQENITNFMKYKFDDLVEKEKKILDYMQKKESIENIEIIHNGDDFTFKQIQLLAECRKIRTVVRHGSIPFPVYPSNSVEFRKVREAIEKNRQTLAHTTHEMTFLIYKAHRDAYEKGKHFSAIIEKSALDFNLNIIKSQLGNDFLKKIINDLKRKIKKYGMKIYVIEEYVPMQIFIIENKVMLSLIHLGVTTGAVIQSEDMVSLYHDFYDDMVRRSKLIENYI
ncbi:hypothetical protein JW949_00935 [Candidatus Woesearchaeota archaeon]|nr:hypothetical protein [Candidatus Woesearchaeota archaeon]